MNAQHRAQLVPGHNSHSPSDPAHANDSGSLFCSPSHYQGLGSRLGFSEMRANVSIYRNKTPVATQ